MNVINFLFQEAIIGASDMKALLKLRDDPHQQCSELLALLHTSGNRQAFIQLYTAIKKEPHLQWLIEDIDELADQSSDQSVIEPLQRMNINETTGTGRFSCLGGGIS